MLSVVPAGSVSFHDKGCPSSIHVQFEHSAEKANAREDENKMEAKRRNIGERQHMYIPKCMM